jgi:hypothetical protein
MATFIVVYNSGAVITNEISSYEFIGMKKETFLLNEFPALANVVFFTMEKAALLININWIPTMISIV